MLRNRILTALVIAFFVLVAIFFLPLWAFSIFFLVAAGVGVYEWAGFLGLTTGKAKSLYTLAFVLVCAGLYLQQAYVNRFIELVSLIWLFAIVSILLFPRGESVYRNPFFVGLIGLIMMVGAWISLNALRSAEQGAFWLLWLFVLTTATDVGAYFVGRAFGRKKLAEQLSPGKTWEGAIGGGLIAMVICAPVLVIWQTYAWLLAFILTAVLVSVSIFGDLFESLLKRTSGLKDSGAILPGHGGVLDRVDSVVAVLPILAWVII